MRARHRCSPALLLCVAGLLAGAAGPAGAATFTVTKTADSLDGACDADCSLREAVQAANADATKDTIALPAGQFQLTRSGAPEDANATGDLDAVNDVVLRGAGADRTVVRALFSSGLEDRLLDLFGANTDAELQGLTLTGGFVHEAGSVGGGVRADAAIDSLLLDHVVLRSNRADGAASFGDGGNLAFMSGAGSLTIRASALLDGRASFAGYGGGLYIDGTAPPAKVMVENTTFAGNSAAVNGFGGAVYFNAATDATFTNVTIVDNHVQGTGTAGIGGVASGLRLRSSIVAGNTQGDGTATDCSESGAPASDGGNVGAPGCGLTLATDVAATDPRLAALSGDPVPVLVPLAGSPAIDHAVGPCPATDARDLPRPSGAACDSGAAEVQVPVPAPAPAPPGAAPADTTAPTLALAKTLSVDRLRRRVTVPLRCPAGETRCSGTVRLTLVVRPKGRKRKPASLLLGNASFSASGGSSARVALTLNKAGRAALKGRASRRVTLSVAVADAAGNRRTQTAATTLVVAGVKKKPRR